MRALINFKICDNARECGGIAICPVNAMYFDEDKNSIVVDQERCTNCGICEKECPIGAIMVASNEEKYNKYIKDIDNDKRTIKDLFVDRYGAVSLSSFFLIDGNEVEEKIKIKSTTLIEVFDSDIVECLLKSIPIKEITDNIDNDLNYFKLDRDEEIKTKYAIDEFPTLLIFKEGNFLGKVSGYYSVNEREEFENKIKLIIKGE